MSSTFEVEEDSSILHLQQTIQGAAEKIIFLVIFKLFIRLAELPRSKRGEAAKRRIPKPAKIPITCARCHTTDARECPNLFLQGPLS